MSPETAVAIFNGLCIAGGALISFGSIALLEIRKRKQIIHEPVNKTEDALSRYRLSQQLHETRKRRQRQSRGYTGP